MPRLKQSEPRPGYDTRVRTRSLFRNSAQRTPAGCQEGSPEPEPPFDRGFFETVFTSAPIGMAIVAVDGRCLEVNDALCRITGQTRDELEATTLHAITHPEDLDCDQHLFHDLLLGKLPSYQVEKRYRHAWGHYLWVLVTVALVRDGRGEPLHVMSQVQDISERKAQATHLEHLIDHDSLTGLFNQRRFREELAREMDRMARYGAESAVLMIDLDNFKNVNDTFGHRAGDDLLRGVAGALRHRMRQTDIVARVGGDEFAMLLPDTGADQAQIVAEGIVKTLGRQIAVLGDRTIHVTASVGVAVSDGPGAAEVLEFADLAMYEAKEAGRNRIVVHRPGSDGDKVSRRTDVEMIRTALDEGRMLLYCQPILDLEQNEAGRYELLLRLRVTEGSEPLLPGSFLYVAERFDLVQQIDYWVLSKAIELIAEYARAGRRLVLHVNLSAKSIGDPRVAAIVEKAIPDFGIDPACLVFELTETTVITRFEQVKAFACRLSGLGCRFALDDFGEGFGSFHYLKSLPFDYFKIDGDFIRGIVTSPTDQLVVQAIVGIARGMGKKTIAESVPDEDACRLLVNIGVDYVQGHCVGESRPLRDALPPVSRQTGA